MTIVNNKKVYQMFILVEVRFWDKISQGSFGTKHRSINKE